MSARGYRFHPAATEELDAAADRYDGQLPGLGLELLEAVASGCLFIRTLTCKVIVDDGGVTTRDVFGMRHIAVFLPAELVARLTRR